MENIYLAVEHHVLEYKQLCDSKLNSVVRKMLKLELTITKLSELASEGAKNNREEEEEKTKTLAELEKEWDSIQQEREELAKERAELQKEREELNRQREEFNRQSERATKEKENKRERKARVTVGLPEDSSVHSQAEGSLESTSSENLDISNEDLRNAAEALQFSSPASAASLAALEQLREQQTAEKQSPQSEKPLSSQANRASVDDEVLDAKKIILVQSFVRRWRDRRNYKFAKRRREVVLEIVNTEKNYINCLQMMTQDYFQPLREMAKDKNLPLSHTLNENMLKTIFSNIEVILNINSILLKKLQQRWEAWHYQQKIGDVFLSMLEFLKCYNQYVNHYNRSLDALAEAAKSPAFLDFIKAKAVKSGRELRDLLIVPIQRIPRYVILLEEARKSTERTHPDYADLSQAVTKMQSIADYVNEKKRDYEALAQVTAVQEMLVGISILEYTRLRYITEGELSAVLEDGKKMEQIHVFLFNELFVCCKQVKKVFGDRKQKQPKNLVGVAGRTPVNFDAPTPIANN